MNKELDTSQEDFFTVEGKDRAQSISDPFTYGKFWELLKRRYYQGYSVAIEELRDVILAAEGVLDPDDCWYDHHGLCQAHNLDNPCEQAVLKQALADYQKLQSLEGKENE
jgi:hypothetical protein